MTGQADRFFQLIIWMKQIKATDWRYQAIIRPARYASFRAALQRRPGCYRDAIEEAGPCLIQQWGRISARTKLIREITGSPPNPIRF